MITWLKSTNKIEDLQFRQEFRVKRILCECFLCKHCQIHSLSLKGAVTQLQVVVSGSGLILLLPMLLLLFLLLLMLNMLWLMLMLFCYCFFNAIYFYTLNPVEICVKTRISVNNLVKVYHAPNTTNFRCMKKKLGGSLKLNLKIVNYNILSIFYNL